MGKKSSSYQEIDPNVGKAQKRQAALAEQQQVWYETEMQPWIMRQTEQQNEWAEQDRQFARDQALWWRDYTQANTEKANQRADEQYARWQATLPSENALVDSVRNYNEAAQQERLNEAATADLTTQYGQQRKALAQQQTMQGIDPTSGQYQANFRALSDEEANNRAQAILAAEQAAKELGWNKRMQAVGIGQGYLNRSTDYANAANQTASVGANASLSANGQASQFGQLGLSNIQNLYNSYQGNMNSLMNQNNSMFNLGMNQSNNNFNYTYNNNQAASSAASGIGNAVGMAGMAMATAYNKSRGV